MRFLASTAIMMLILFVALFIGVWAADSIQKDLSSLKSDVQRAAADLIVGSTINIQDDLWDISARLGKSTQTLKVKLNRRLTFNFD